MATYEVTVTFEDEMLGTAPGNPEIYRDWVQSKRPDAENGDDEAAMLPVNEEIAQGTTVFRRDAGGNPILLDYQIKGFFKDACGALRRADDTESADLKNYKKEIDGLVFVLPRQIVLQLPPGGAIGICQRPLRAQTPKGERVSLVRSETVPPGTTATFQVRLLSGRLDELLREWLDYGVLRGMGQWRNSGAGRFLYTIQDVNAEQVEK